MRVKNIDFLLTFRCTAECLHCSYRASPRRQGYINLVDAEKWLTELKPTQPLQSVTVHGGEPFLHFDIMKGILEKAKELEIEKRWVITNGFWIENEVVAKDKLSELRNLGMSSITFSVDAFHQEFTSLHKLRIGIEMAAQMGFKTVAVDSYFVGSEDRDNRFNHKTKEIARSLEGIPNVQFSRFPLSFEGRAADFLVKEEFFKEEIPNGKCHTPFWLGGDLKHPETIEIDCEGNVTFCPGISIGNAKEQPLIEIISDYDYSQHPIIRVVVDEGPIGLLELAKAKGYRGTERFINECHLCYEMRRFLHKYYARYLAPESCYK